MEAEPGVEEGALIGAMLAHKAMLERQAFLAWLKNGYSLSHELQSQCSMVSSRLISPLKIARR
jgi:hypothetical protein